MAFIRSDKSGNFLVSFRFGGKEFNRSVDTQDRAIAEAALNRVEETLMRLKRGWLTMPSDADPGVFVLSGGALSAKPVALDLRRLEPPQHSIKSLFLIYQMSLTPEAKEANSLLTEKIHLDHILNFYGEEREFRSLDLVTVQQYADARAKKVKRDTIKKELTTLRMVAKWAFKRGHIDAPLTWGMNDLTLPKTGEKPSFQSWERIEARIAMGGLTTKQVKELWESLYLNGQQVAECLGYIRAHARYPFVYPMIAIAAYTGARRAEILRSERHDWDFKNGSVAIRQKKSDKSKTFTLRHVPIHETLADVMKAWFNVHPGGQSSICTEDGEPIGDRMATKYFRQAVKGSKWSVLHGFHAFRHSLASIMATKGVDQRFINDILGHSTEDMERRYRHLFPAAKTQMMKTLFSSPEPPVEA